MTNPASSPGPVSARTIAIGDFHKIDTHLFVHVGYGKHLSLAQQDPEVLPDGR